MVDDQIVKGVADQYSRIQTVDTCKNLFAGYFRTSGWPKSRRLVGRGFPEKFSFLFTFRFRYIQ